MFRGYNEEDLSCKTCGKQFAQKATLVRHIKNHQRSTEECGECGMKVKNLVRHSKTQHEEKDRLRSVDNVNLFLETEFN